MLDASEIAVCVTMAIATVGILVWEVYHTLTWFRSNATVVQVVRDVLNNEVFFGLPFGWGAIAGHFFGPATMYSVPWFVAVPGLLGCAGAFGLAGMFWGVPQKWRVYLSLLICALGFVSGAIAWPS